MKSSSLDDVWGSGQTHRNTNVYNKQLSQEIFANGRARDALTEQSAPYSASRRLLNVERTPNPLVSNDGYVVVPHNAYTEAKGTACPFEPMLVEDLEYNGTYDDRRGRPRQMKVSIIPPADKDYTHVADNQHLTRLQGLRGKDTLPQYGNKREVAGIVNRPDPPNAVQARQLQQRAQKAVAKNIHMNRSGVQGFPTFDSGRGDQYDGENPLRITPKLTSIGYRTDQEIDHRRVDTTMIARSSAAHVAIHRSEMSGTFHRENNAAPLVEKTAVACKPPVRQATLRDKTDAYNRFPVAPLAHVNVVSQYRVKDAHRATNMLLQRPSIRDVFQPHTNAKATVTLNPRLDDKPQEHSQFHEAPEPRMPTRAAVQLHPNLDDVARLYKPVATTAASNSQNIVAAVLGDADDSEIERILRYDNTQINATAARTTAHIGDADDVLVQRTAQRQPQTNAPAVRAYRHVGGADAVGIDTTSNNTEFVSRGTLVRASVQLATESCHPRPIMTTQLHEAPAVYIGAPLGAKDARSHDASTLNAQMYNKAPVYTHAPLSDKDAPTLAANDLRHGSNDALVAMTRVVHPSVAPPVSSRCDTVIDADPLGVTTVDAEQSRAQPVLRTRHEMISDTPLTSDGHYAHSDVRAGGTRNATARDNLMNHAQSNGAAFVPIAHSHIRGAFEPSNLTAGTVSVDTLNRYTPSRSLLDDRMTPALPDTHVRTLASPRISAGFAISGERHTPRLGTSAHRG